MPQPPECVGVTAAPPAAGTDSCRTAGRWSSSPWATSCPHTQHHVLPPSRTQSRVERPHGIVKKGQCRGVGRKALRVSSRGEAFSSTQSHSECTPVPGCSKGQCVREGWGGHDGAPAQASALSSRHEHDGIFAVCHQLQPLLPPRGALPRQKNGGVSLRPPLMGHPRSSVHPGRRRICVGSRYGDAKVANHNSRKGLARQKLGLDRWTNPKPQRSTRSPRYGVPSCRGGSAGVAKRPRERSPTRNP